MWQVVGLSILWYVGSSQSKESDEQIRRENRLNSSTARFREWQATNSGVRQEIPSKAVILFQGLDNRSFLFSLLYRIYDKNKNV
jgi:hypothetical protein